MTTCEQVPIQIEQLRQRVSELELRVQRRDATIVQCEAVIKKLRERVGIGFRDEVLAFSDSIRGLLQ